MATGTMEIIDLLSSDGEDIVDLCSDGEDSTHMLSSDSEDDHDYHDRGNHFRLQPLHSLSTTSDDMSSDEEPIMLDVNGFFSTHQAPSYHRPAQNRPATGNISKFTNKDFPRWPLHSLSTASSQTSSDEEPIMMDVDGFMSTHQASSYRGPAQNKPMPSMTSVIDFETDSTPEYPQKSHFTVDEKAVYEEALQHISEEKGEEDLPEGVLSVSLLKHQKIALAWMVSRENSTHCAGGILADDQGLGKTISTIALIQKERLQQSRFMTNDSESEISDDGDDEAVLVMDKKELRALAIQSRNVIAQPKKKTRVSSTKSTLRPTSRPAAGTLVVCPASVLKQWASELSAKVTQSAELSVLVYHGGSRTRDPTELAECDVVVTTYAIVSLEIPKESTEGGISVCNKMKLKKNSAVKAKKKKKPSNLNGGPLAMVRWFRVVLDEAHTIKSHRTQMAKACCALSAERRWCLSGTPIQNNIDDLYSYFRFLKYEPYSKYSSFRYMIKNSLSKNATRGYKKLQTVLRIVLLRRTKETLLDGEPIIKIPPKTIQLSKIDFTKEERAFYLNLEGSARKTLKASEEFIKKNYVHILALLSQLRQACNHPFLLKGKQPFRHSLALAKQLPAEITANVFENVERGVAKCTICSRLPGDAVAATCGHVFCRDCVYDKIIENNDIKDKVCPAPPHCGKEISHDSLFSASALKLCLWPKSEDQPFSICESSYVSSKIRATINILKSIINTEDDHDAMGSIPSEVAPTKAIVFTQWTGMLDLLEHSLTNKHIEFRRLDGSMPLNIRERAVKEFNTDPEVRVIIMSLKAGNLGLNMVAACHVIMLDPWWNPSTEDQAVDRAHRIGQTRAVTVSRLTVKDTVEDRILSLQEGKKKMIQSALGEDQSGGSAATRLTVEDLKYLFKI
ncbi:unnamed protein product [Urochloa decumbens]|uniref:Uncharacterized protein n=1 Tax=Urochloa decumbens TaxID=240449 RepID=A0ABC9CSE7_9POAL